MCGDKVCTQSEVCEDDNCMCGDHECDVGHVCEENAEAHKECIGKTQSHFGKAKAKSQNV